MSVRVAVACMLHVATTTGSLVVGLSRPAPAAAQEPPAGEAPRAELSRDTVELGDAFELRLTLPLPAGRTAYFPDTLPTGRSVESLRPVEWRLEPVDRDGRALTIVYALIGYRVGVSALPDVTIFTGPAGSGEAEVGSWDDVETDPELAASLTRHVANGGEVWIASVLDVENGADALTPRPADDVVGASWSRGALLAALALGSVLAWTLAVTVREWLVARRRARPIGPATDPLEDARRAALEALDELRGLGLVEAGRVEELYGRSSAAVRAYVEHLDPEWGPAHTSSELMHDLSRRANGDAAPELHREMHVAEVVKFGRLRPDAAEAERHLTSLRAWVAGPTPRLGR